MPDLQDRADRRDGQAAGGDAGEGGLPRMDPRGLRVQKGRQNGLRAGQRRRQRAAVAVLRIVRHVRGL